MGRQDVKGTCARHRKHGNGSAPKKGKKSLPSVTSDYVSHQDRPRGWLTAPDKIGGWAKMRTDMDDV